MSGSCAPVRVSLISDCGGADLDLPDDVLYVPTITCGNDRWVMTETVTCRIKAVSSAGCLVSAAETGLGAQIYKRSTEEDHCSFMFKGVS